MTGRWGAAILAATVLGVAGTASAAEELVLETYPGQPAWKEVTNRRQGVTFLREQIPNDQKLANYKDILAAQAMTPPVADPSLVLKAMFIRVQSACDGVRVNGPKVGEEDGYKVAYGQIYCGRQKGEKFGVTMFFKVIAGDDATYSINRDFRVPPSATGGVQTFAAGQADAALALLQAQSAANDYLVKSVYLCGSKSKAERCQGKAK